MPDDTCRPWPCKRRKKARSLPSHWSNQLSEIIGRLENGIAAHDRQGNMDLLRGGVFPLISDYVRRTHDQKMLKGHIYALIY